MCAPGRPHTASYSDNLQKVYCLSSNLAHFPNYQQAVRGSWSFLMALSASLPKHTISNSCLPSTCAQGAVSAPGHTTACAGLASRLQWPRNPGTAPPTSPLNQNLCVPGPVAPKKLWWLWTEQWDSEEEFQDRGLFLQRWIREQVQLCDPAS